MIPTNQLRENGEESPGSEDPGGPRELGTSVGHVSLLVPCLSIRMQLREQKPLCLVPAY